MIIRWQCLCDDSKLRAILAQLELASPLSVSDAVVGTGCHEITAYFSDYVDLHVPVEVTQVPMDDTAWVTDESVQVGDVAILCPTNVFGNGIHPTTQLCLSWIESSKLDGCHVLDVGSGSGILSIRAMQCGAARCRGIELDPTAVSVSQQNVAGYDGIEILCQDVATYESADVFDVVIANIPMVALESQLDRLKSFVLPGGRLVVSGFTSRWLPGLHGWSAQIGVPGIVFGQKDDWQCIEFALN